MLIMTMLLAVAGIFDHLFHKIPNILILVMFIAGLIHAWIISEPLGIPYALIRMLLAVVIFYPVFVIGALGAGDIKLLAVCCGYMSAARAIWFIFLAFSIASVAGVIGLIHKKEIKKRIRRLIIYVNNFLKTGKVERYHCNTEAALHAGVALAGPMFVSALLGVGGLY